MKQQSFLYCKGQCRVPGTAIGHTIIADLLAYFAVAHIHASKSSGSHSVFCNFSTVLGLPMNFFFQLQCNLWKAL